MDALLKIVGSLLVVVASTAYAEPTWILDDDGCKHWNPRPQPKETIKWTGSCVDGFASGPGEARWMSDGRLTSTDIVTKINGKMSGSGTITHRDGIRYEGEFGNGSINGKGIMRWPDGTQYEGDFRSGSITGMGVLQFSNGDRYEGQFVDGLVGGKVAVTWSSGQDPMGLERLMTRTPQRMTPLAPGQVRVRPEKKAGEDCKPKYPDFARRTDAEGTTRVRYLVNESGRVSKVHIAESSGETPSHKLLDFAASVAVWACLFEPGTVDGKAVEMWAIQQYNWELQ